MNLKQFRDQFPGFRPNALCEHRDGTQLEVISWPYLDKDGGDTAAPIFIMARTPLDPLTIKRYCIMGDDPELSPLMACCDLHGTNFTPIVASLRGDSFNITGCPFCSTEISLESHQNRTDTDNGDV
jgi:hypothetical protein